MRILVTGATGFLGRALCRTLTQAGHAVVALSRSAGTCDRDRCGAVEPWPADLRDPGMFASLPVGIDTIVHLAQSPDYARGTDGMVDMTLVNITATALLADHARKAGCRHFVFASTGGVYEPYHGTLDEAAAVAPFTAYPATKYAGELVARAYDGDMAVLRLRPFFPFGPGQRARLFPGLADRIRAGVPVRLNGDGDGLRINPIFVGDAVALIARAIAERWSGCLNLAGAETVAMRRAAGVIGTVLSTPPRFEVLPEAEPTRIVGAIDRLRGLAPDFAFTPFDRAVALTFAADTPHG